MLCYVFWSQVEYGIVYFIYLGRLYYFAKAKSILLFQFKMSHSDRIRKHSKKRQMVQYKESLVCCKLYHKMSCQLLRSSSLSGDQHKAILFAFRFEIKQCKFRPWTMINQNTVMFMLPPKFCSLLQRKSDRELLHNKRMIEDQPGIP